LLESSFFKKINSEKINSGKVNYFLIFDSVMKNKLENISLGYVMENELENNLLIFYFFQVY